MAKGCPLLLKPNVLAWRCPAEFFKSQGDIGLSRWDVLPIDVLSKEAHSDPPNQITMTKKVIRLNAPMILSALVSVQ